MSDVTGHIETDVRERILVTAERLFREIGYQKTTVADIARALRMSPANIYRFFDSKKSINIGVARRLMGQVEAESQAIAQASGSAVERLRDLLKTIHEMNAAAMWPTRKCTRWSPSRWTKIGMFAAHT
jgi:AcrR family transcriptional regulator